MYVNTHIWPTNRRFGNIELWNCYELGWVAFRAEVESTLDSAIPIGRVQVQMFLSVSIVSADCLQRHFGKEGIRPCGFDEA